MLVEKDKKKTGGLAGIVAGDSAICLCSAEDENLLYRGYSIEDLATRGTFEETAWLLLRGELPTRRQLEDYKARLKKLRGLPSTLKEILEKIPPSANMMDVLRTGCSVLGNIEPETTEIEKFAIADRLLASFPSMLLYWKKFHESGKRIDLDTGEDSHAAHILHLIHGKSPQEQAQRVMDISLVLYAEHDFNASTFTVKTIASTLSDFYSAICGGIGALRGPLHGGANEAAMALIARFKNPDEAENGIKHMLEQKQLVMGFGHRVYTTSDPRSPIMKKWAERLSHLARDQRIYPIAERIEKVMMDEKKLFPNIDFYTGVAYYFCQIPTEMYTPLFVMSRIAGWSAHLLEQRANNKLIRPLSNYIGPNLQSWIPLENRL